MEYQDGYKIKTNKLEQRKLIVRSDIAENIQREIDQLNV